MTITDEHELVPSFGPRHPKFSTPQAYERSMKAKEPARTTGRSRVRIAPEVLEELVFGYTQNPVKIRNIKVIDVYGNDYFEFEIEGEDVPQGAPEVVALCEEQMNRARQRFLTMRFEPVK